MSAAGQQQLAQHPSFKHEQGFLSRSKSAGAPHAFNDLNWRI